jgi:drug/metabolite transporter (DMT)-like permease
MKTVLVISFASLCAAVGEAFIARGMRQMGDASALGLGQALGHFVNPWVLAGVALTAVFFALFSWSLSWADLSYAQPLTALSFVFGLVVSRLWLGEQVSWWRWLGVAVIVLGVTLVSHDPKPRTPPPPPGAAL